MRYDRLQSHQDAQYKHQYSRPYRAPGSNGCQRYFFVRQPARHQRIDKIHAEAGDHSHDDRDSQLQGAHNFSGMIFMYIYSVH